MIDSLDKARPFINLILLVIGTLLLRTMLSKILLQLESKIVAKTRNDLPPVYKIFLSGLFAKKAKTVEPTQENSQSKELQPKISFKVDQMHFTAKEKEEFQRLCEYTPVPSEPSSALMHVFPHVLGQQFIVSLISHPIFPISAIGSLHLRSYFEVLQEKLLKEFLSNTSPSSFSMQGNYWGCVANQKRGTDLVCSLEIWHNESAQAVWKELIVIYSTKNTRNHDTSAQDILQRYSGYCDFTNLEVEKSESLSQVSATKDETWSYGILSGDINPIHMSQIGAKLFGQKGRIAHGAMILGKALAHLEQRQQIAVPKKLGVSFKGPIPCGSTLDVKATYSSSSEKIVKDVDLYVLKNDRPNICIRSF